MAAHETAAGGVPAAASERVMLGSADAFKDNPNLPRIQSLWVRRRFGLAPMRAALVAELAMAGGAA